MERPGAGQSRPVRGAQPRGHQRDVGIPRLPAAGNVVDLAVAVVIGTAFNGVVQGIVDGFLNPLVAAVFGEPDLSQVATFTLNEARFSLGLILTRLIQFLLVATAVYFFVVAPMNRLLQELRERQGEDTGRHVPEVPEDVALLREIRDLLQSGSARG